MLSRTDQVSFLKTTHRHATHAVTQCVCLEHLPACNSVMFFFSAMCKHVRVYAFSLHRQLKCRLGSHGYWLWWKADRQRVPLRYMNIMLCKHDHDWAIDFIYRGSSFTAHMPLQHSLYSTWVNTFSWHCVSSSVSLHMLVVCMKQKTTEYLCRHKYDVLLTVKIHCMSTNILYMQIRCQKCTLFERFVPCLVFIVETVIYFLFRFLWWKKLSAFIWNGDLLQQYLGQIY